MPVDTSIYGNLLRPPKSITDYGAEMDQAASAQLGLQQGQMNLLSAKQAQQDEQNMRRLFQDPSFDPATPEGLQQIYKVGGPKAGMAYQKSALDIRETQANIADKQAKTKETGVDIAGKEFDQKTKRTQQHVQGLASVTDVPAALRWLDEAKASGELPPDKVDEIKAQISAGKLPLAQWRQQAFTGGMTVIEQQKAQEEARKQAETERNNIEQNKIAKGQLGVSQGQLGVARENTGIARENLNLRQQELSKPYEVTGPDGTPILVRQNKLGEISPVEGYAPKSASTPKKPLPATIVKQQNEAVLALGQFKGLDSDLAKFEDQIKTGELKLSLPGNLARRGMNAAGVSSEQSRNLATLKNKLEGMRNSVLLLGKGVQTEGDAARALDEIVTNINDQELVAKRLPELRLKLQRDADLQKNSVDLMRSNYGHDPLDFGKFENQPATVVSKPDSAKAPKTGEVVDGYVFKGGDPGDPKSWSKK